MKAAAALVKAEAALAKVEAALAEAEAAFAKAGAAFARAASHVPRFVKLLPTTMGEELWKGEGSYSPQLPRARQRSSASKAWPLPNSHQA